MDPDERHKNQSFSNFNTHQTWDESSLMEFQARIEQQFNQFSQPLQTNQPKVHPANNDPEWDPKSTLNNLSFLEQKIHQVRDLVHLITNRRNQSMNGQDEMLIQQQHLITADLTSIIVQLITTAGTLLPSRDSSVNHLGQVNPLPGAASCSKTLPQNDHHEEHESKDEEEPEEEEHEHLPEGTYEILQLEKEEILAPHTHFCSICGKGFKRDANLRMHMRGHGDEYKTPAALAKPNNKASSEPMLIKRYSCPYIGCKRNKDHKKFQPLKTILCVKNHYKRTHCEKSYTCSRCKAKKFSVIADLKTHEKHCGRDKWLCSCGTTFSRKDKLLGHISLFQGHTAAVSPDEAAAKGQNRVQEMNVTENMQEDHGTYFSPMNFDGNALGGFQEFPQPPFQDSENEFAFFASGSGTCDYSCKPGNHME